MTNAEVLHQVEHGYRMQAPQVCVSFVAKHVRSMYSVNMHVGGVALANLEL